jgi:hypothetical protein
MLGVDNIWSEDMKYKLLCNTLMVVMVKSVVVILMMINIKISVNVKQNR